MQTNESIANRRCDPSRGKQHLPAGWTDDQSRYSRVRNASDQLQHLAADTDDEWVEAAVEVLLDDLARLSGPHFVRASELRGDSA